LIAAASKKDFFATADIVTLHLRLSETTAGTEKRQDLETMRTDALFVNTSQGRID
jgi:D-3-phosphoglycerate dehydrogenase